MSDLCGNCGKPYKAHLFEREIYCNKYTNGDIFVKKDMEFFKEKFGENANEFDSIVVDMFETIEETINTRHSDLRERIENMRQCYAEPTHDDKIFNSCIDAVLALTKQ